MRNHAGELNSLIESCSNKLENAGFSDFKEGEEPKNSNIFFTSSVYGMKAVSHVIEDQAIVSPGPLTFYSGFQRFSRVGAQSDRYLKILAAGHPVYLFGAPDTALWQDPLLHLIPIKEPQHPEEPTFTHNWMVVLYNPEAVSMALVTRETANLLRPTHAPDKLVYRTFQGFWTYENSIIGKVVEILDDFIAVSEERVK